MPAGAISGVAVVTSGSSTCVGAAGVGAGDVGVFENSAIGTVSVGAPGVLERPQLHGAYQEPYRTDDALRAMCEFAPATVLR